MKVTQPNLWNDIPFIDMSRKREERVSNDLGNELEEPTVSVNNFIICLSVSGRRCESSIVIGPKSTRFKSHTFFQMTVVVVVAMAITKVTLSFSFFIFSFPTFLHTKLYNLYT